MQTAVQCLKPRLRDRSGTVVTVLYFQLYDDSIHKVCDLLLDFQVLLTYSTISMQFTGKPVSENSGRRDL